MFPGVLDFSLSGKGLKEKKWAINIFDIKDFAFDKH